MKCVCHEHKPKCDCLKASDFELPEETSRARFWLWLAWLVVAAGVVVILLGRCAKAEDVPPEEWCPVYRLWAASLAPLVIADGASSHRLTIPAAEEICLELGAKEEAARKAAPEAVEVP